MKLKSEDSNALEECASLTSEFGQEPGGSIQMNFIPEIRFGKQQIAAKGWAFTVELREASVVVVTSNCQFVKESRLGDAASHDDAEIETVDTQINVTEMRKSRSLGASWACLGERKVDCRNPWTWRH